MPTKWDKAIEDKIKEWIVSTDTVADCLGELVGDVIDNDDEFDAALERAEGLLDAVRVEVTFDD